MQQSGGQFNTLLESATQDYAIQQSGHFITTVLESGTQGYAINSLVSLLPLYFRYPVLCHR